MKCLENRVVKHSGCKQKKMSPAEAITKAQYLPIIATYVTQLSTSQSEMNMVKSSVVAGCFQTHFDSGCFCYLNVSPIVIRFSC